MTDFTQAADAIKRMAVQYKNIVAVAEALETMGSIEGATKEANAALAKARATRDAFLDRYNLERTKLSAEIEAAKVEAESVLTAAKQEAAYLKAKAIDAGEKKAAAMIEAANAKAQLVTGEMASRVDAATMDFAMLSAGIDTKTKEFNDLSAAVVELSLQKSALEVALADIKAKFA